MGGWDMFLGCYWTEMEVIAGFLEGSPQNIFCIFLPVQNLHAAYILIPLLNSFLDGSSRIFFENSCGINSSYGPHTNSQVEKILVQTISYIKT